MIGLWFFLKNTLKIRRFGKHLAQNSIIMTAAYGEAQEIKEARGMYDRLVSLSKKYPEDKKIREMLAQGSVIMIRTYGEAQDWKEARGTYDRLVALASKNPEDKKNTGNAGPG